MRLLAALLLLATTEAVADDWVEVRPQDRPITVAASGIVDSADKLRFGPPPSQSWRIAITDLAREGTMVKQGAMLAAFDGSATDDRVRTLSADLNARRSELESLAETQAREVQEDAVRLAEAESNADKAARKAAVSPDVYAGLEYRKLLEEKSLTGKVLQQERERSQLARKVRAGRRAELEADIRRLESELQGARQTLQSFRIVAPRDGLVIVGTDRSGQKLDVNDAVNPGMIVVELADEKALIVQAEVPEYAAARIKVGQTAKITIDAFGSTQIVGEVTSVASIVRRQSRFSQAMIRDVQVSLPPELIAELRPGMSAKLQIVVDVQQNALAVPDNAIEYRGGRPGLVVRGDGWRGVVLGGASEGMHIIEDGLAAGDEVAL